MAYKIAVATSDGKKVDTHFGMAEDFTIIEVSDDGNYQEVERRPAAKACLGSCSTVPKDGKTQHSAEDNALLVAAENLADCSYVLAAKIGPGAVRALAVKNITAFDIVMDVDEAIGKINIYREKISQRKKGI